MEVALPNNVSAQCAKKQQKNQQQSMFRSEIIAFPPIVAGEDFSFLRHDGLAS